MVGYLSRLLNRLRVRMSLRFVLSLFYPWEGLGGLGG